MLSIFLSTLTSLAIAATNTNQCLALLPSLQSNCPLGLSCCSTINAFYDAGCFCNPLATGLVGSSLSQLQLLQPACRAIYPPEWIKPKPNCANLVTHTYNNGQCAIDDMTLDAIRAQNALSFTNSIVSLNADTCFNYTKLLGAVKQVFAPDAVASASYGLGVYVGPEMIAEYFGLISTNLNKGFFYMTPTANPNPLMYISPNGSQLVLGETVTQSFIHRGYTSSDIFLEQRIQFNNCSTVINTLDVPDTSMLTGKPAGPVALANGFAQAMAIGHSVE
ncbi:hypothetical protein HDU91_006758 [Kappamyces sp. JEL0680]|nr:hypothetical protein HDU91_006758 [Kappamyces sp. JEL0680]